MNWLQLTEEQRWAACGRWFAAEGRPSTFCDPEFTGTCDPDAAARAVGARLIAPGDAEFPTLVRTQIENCGPWLVRGTLAHRGPLLAVVGSRAVGHEGARLCSRIVRDVAAAGVGIVSGGAIGVDTLAHEAALSVAGKTIAILPSSFDRPTPSRNVRMFARIEAEGGALVSEYPSGVTARKFHFHRRNQLIAGCVAAVLVIRARERSGTMITAHAAQRLGTPLLAVPGSPEDATAGGCNLLLRAGARCVTSAAEVLEELDVATDAPRDSVVAPATLSEKARVLLELLTTTPRTTDELCTTSGFRAHEVMIALTELELLGQVRLQDGRWRVR